MRIPPPRHSWNISPREAVALQKSLAADIRIEPFPRPPRIVAGGDVAFSTDGLRLVGAWVTWDRKTGDVLETAHAILPVAFPYVPGLLSFREAPVMLHAAAQLCREPDVFMLDAHGFSHPRRCGLASHVGLLLNRPSIGCAKSRLCGEHRMPGPRRGAAVRLRDQGQTIGRVVRTRTDCRPIFVSIGHRATLDDAVRLTLRCGRGYRMPEPTRLAHALVTRMRAEI